MFWKSNKRGHSLTSEIPGATPWPTQKPFADLNEENAIGRPVQGLSELLDASNLAGNETITIIEVGVEMGGSTRLLLRKFPNARIFSIDPWIDAYPLPPIWKSDLEKYTARSNGSLLPIFQSYNWKYRDQITLLKHWSHDGLRVAYSMGVKPDLVFIDGDHRYHGVLSDLFLCYALFPGVQIFGDDWEFAPTAKKYKGIALPVRKAAEDFCDHIDGAIQADQNSYWIQTRPVGKGK